ncbi:mediator complex subunit, partial [Coemansia sp. RSA 1836]
MGGRESNAPCAVVTTDSIARQIQKCQNAIAYLDAQNRFFEGSVDSLYAAFLALAGVRVRNYDVGTAVDVLTTGSYRRLPRAIARSVGRPRLGRRQVAQALRAIDDIIRARMLGGEAVPLAMRQYAVGGGRIVFRVRGEFEATLTLLQRGAAIPWHVVGVRMLAGGDVPYSSQKILVDSITQHAQQILVDAAAGGGGGAPQLAQLYDFLHRQALAALLDAVARQAAALRRARWEGALAAETSSDRAAVVLRYWASSSSSSSAASSSVGSSSSSSSSSGANSVELRIVALPVPRPIHAPAAEGAQAAAVAGDCAFARIERARRDLIPKAGLRITWTAAAGLAAPQTWTRTAAALGDLAGDGWRLAVDPAAVDVERLLRQATAQHASAVLEGLRAAVAAKQHLGLGVEESKDAAANQITTSLRAWFRPGEGAVDFSVDGVSGRLAATLAMDGGGLGGGGGAANMSSASLSAADAFRVLADRANRSPWRVAELLVDLRAALALADLDALAERALGLRRQESASGFPLRVSQADADMLARDVGGGAGVQRLRFYGVEGTEGDGAWFVMAAMTDRLRFRLVRLSSAGSTTAATAAGLVRDVTQVEALQVDRLFASVARRLSSSSSSSGGSKQPSGSKESFCARAEAMLAGRTAIGLDYVNALASAVRARLAVRAVQAQLAAQRIAYAFRLPKFSTSPHGPRAAVSQELSVVGIDRMGVYELDEHVPVLYVPVAALMRAAPVNWRVAARAVLPDEARRMVSLRVAADEATSSLPAPCHVVAQLPVALGGLPQPVAQAYADAVYLSSHASADGGYHQHQHQNQNQHQHQNLADGSGYSKIVRVYRRVATAVQRLIRDWAELHLMAHVARHLFAWEQRALRRVLASTVAYYPASLGPYTKAAVAPLPLPCSPEIVVQCLGSCFLSISCCVPSS